MVRPLQDDPPILDDGPKAKGKVQIAKMNVDENREIPAKFGIRGIPTLMLFKDGQLAATKVGALNKAATVRLPRPAHLCIDKQAPMELCLLRARSPPICMHRPGTGCR
jgi:thiol-disulfide isomerase/thioredoxin